MSDSFEIAFRWIRRAEGGWVNDPRDAGGETYCGIARNSHPSWSGWEIIDRIVSSASSPAVRDSLLTTSDELQARVSDFYESGLWADKHLDELPLPTAIAIFDTLTNHGKGARLIQEVCNALYGSGIEEDNVWGPATFGVVFGVVTGPRPAERSFVESLLSRRRAYYHDLASRPGQMKFLPGWLNRLSALLTFLVSEVGLS